MRLYVKRHNYSMEQRFIIRYLKGETTAEERVKMLEWLEADSSHLEEFKCLRKMFDAAVCSETIGVEQKQTHSRMSRPVFFRRPDFVIASP